MIEENMKEHLSAALGGDGPQDARHAAGLRLRCELQPLAGPGARIMPPTYAGDDGPVYVTENRRFGDEVLPCVLLDSVASQANRLEDALLARIGEGGIEVPDVVVDQEEFGVHSALEFSHRVFDAWVEDARLDGERFGKTAIYEQLSSVINRGVALPLMERFPVGLLLGCWASRKSNPQGTTRIARAVVSEIVAIDVVEGVRPQSRIDRHHVSNEVKVAQGQDGERFAVLPEGAPTKGAKLLGKGDKAGKPSVLGYGNVTPSIARHGGITARHALQLTIVSLPALRATCPRAAGDSPRPERDLAARRLLAALALAMLEAQTALGWDLRSGCQLVPSSEPTIELVGRLGDLVARWPLFELGAEELVADAVKAARAAGLQWETDPLRLQASPQQLKLLRRSLGREEAVET
jgi:CRISPR-associated protein Csb1